MRREVAALLGEDFAGIVGSDRWWAGYSAREAAPALLVAPAQRLQGAYRRPGAEKEFGEAGLALCERVFWAWEVFQHTGDRPPQADLARLERQYEPLVRLIRRKERATSIAAAWREPDQGLAGTVDLRRHEGVEPTNNHAERALRGPVIYRKLYWAANPSKASDHPRLLSASVTCRLQRRSLFDYLAEVLDARVRGHPAPLLA